jgi:phage-related protein
LAKSVIDDSKLETDIEIQQSVLNLIKSSFSNLVPNIPYWKKAKNIPHGILALLKMAMALMSIVTNSEAVHNIVQDIIDQRFISSLLNSFKQVLNQLLTMISTILSLMTSI